MGEKTKVLLVDDDIINNKLNLMILKRRQHVEIVDVCYNGAEALQFIKENCVEQETDKFPQIILLDIKMPVMNGIEFLEHFEQLPARVTNRIQVVVLSSSSNERDLKAANQFRIAGYINKPLKLEEFESQLEKII